MSKKVPLLDVGAQNGPISNALRSAFERVLTSSHFILGQEVERFERSMSDYIDAPHTLGVSSGTDAILLALMTLGIGPGDEVLCPTFTFFATAGCVSRLGATPVFVDICPGCFNIDIEDAKAKITSRTKAIIPVHLFGQCADMDGIMALAKAHNLYVIEDAAQAIGARYKGQSAGTIGDFGTFSFFPSKNLGALGDAGMLVIKDPELAEKARVMHVHGSKPKYIHHYVGGNFRLDALQAAFLDVKLKHLDGYETKRSANAAYYRQAFEGLSGVASPQSDNCQQAAQIEAAIGKESKMILPSIHPSNHMIWNQFTLRIVPDGARDALKAYLNEHNIGCEIYYPKCLHEQTCFQGASQGGDTIKQATKMASQCLSIPIYAELEQSQLDWVADRVAKFLDNL
ncbi:MAG TPA: DegT/DnrJ/EryC1/StrS family aminotransferase [Opitutales bacterium]|nr:DegT/DnrJ/EryC1/StrS family aminotransferase [Opitutales bacterium]